MRGKSVNYLNQGEILLEISKGGVVISRNIKDPRDNDFLPFYSVPTEADAEDLIVALCKRSYDDQHYIRPNFSGSTDDLPNLTRVFDLEYQLQGKGKRRANEE